MDHFWDMSIVPLEDDNIAIQSKRKERERVNRPATASTGTSQSSTVPGKTEQQVPTNVKTGQSVFQSSLNPMTASAASKTSAEQAKSPSSASTKTKILNVSSAETTKPAVDRATTQRPMILVGVSSKKTLPGVSQAKSQDTLKETTLAGVSSKKKLPGVTQAKSQDTLKEPNVPVFQPSSSSRKRTICQTLETQASPHPSSRSQEKKLKTTHNTTTTNIQEEHQHQLIKSLKPIAAKQKRSCPCSTDLIPITKKKHNASAVGDSSTPSFEPSVVPAHHYYAAVKFMLEIKKLKPFPPDLRNSLLKLAANWLSKHYPEEEKEED